MLPSLSDLDTSKLSDEARAALAAAQRIGDGAPIDEVAAEARISPEELQRRIAKLGAEWREHSGLVALPKLSMDDYEALRDSIETHGQLVPVLVADDGTVVDGIHRLRACRELNIDPLERRLAKGLSADQLRCLALVVNVARRQLAPGARRGLIVDELLRDATRSDRSIAAVTGSSHSQVGRIRAELEHNGEVDQRSTRVGANGVTQPATRPTRDPDPEPELPTGVVDVTLRINRSIADQLNGAAWVDCKAFRLVAVDPGVYALEVRA